MSAPSNEYIPESFIERSFEYGKFLIDLTASLTFDTLEYLTARFDIEDYDDPTTPDIFLN